MIAQNLIVGINFLICLFSATICFSFLPKINFLRENFLSSALSVSISCFIGTTAICLFCWYPNDFVMNIARWQYLLPLFCLSLIFAALLINKPFIIAAGVLMAISISVFLGEYVIYFLPASSLVYNKLLTILVWWIFAMGFQATSGLNPLPQVEAITISLGCGLLYFFGTAPFIFGATAAGLLACFIIAYFYSQVHPLGINSSPVFGFILGWLGVLSYGEYISSCFLVFSMYYLAELLLCSIRWISFLPQYRQFMYNSAAVQAFSSGAPAQSIIRSFYHINALLLTLGLFQINGSNDYSIPFFTAILCGWQLYRTINWQMESKTLKETNQELIKEIKSSLGQLIPNDKSEDKKDKN